MFTDYLGDTPRARLLDFLGDHPTSDYNVTEMAAKADLSRATVYKVLDDLVDVGMVRHTRDVGQSKMYQIVVDHEVVQSVLRADMTSARDEPDQVVAQAG